MGDCPRRGGVLDSEKMDNSPGPHSTLVGQGPIINNVNEGKTCYGVLWRRALWNKNSNSYGRKPKVFPTRRGSICSRGPPTRFSTSARRFPSRNAQPPTSTKRGRKARK